MLDVAFLLLLLGWSAGVGWALMRLLRTQPDRLDDAIALALPLGMGTLALILFGLGEIGWLTPLSIGALLVGGVVVMGFLVPLTPPSPGGRGRPRLTLSPRERVAEGRVRASWSLLSLDRVFDLALVAVLIGTFLTALTPVTDGDALCYHLQVPKVFLQAKSLTFEPDLHETVYPLVTESIYAAALALRGPVACRLVQWSLGIIFAWNVVALARPVLGSRARWAGTIALLVPAISNGMSAPLNDVALAAFGTAALHSFVRWQESSTWRAALLAGLLSGFALGTKYPALVWVGLMEIAGVLKWSYDSIFTSRRSSVPRPRPTAILVFSLTAILIGGAWYVRAYIHTGNPVHPFFRHTFGGAGIDDVLDPIKRPLAPTIWNVLTALAPMTLEPDRFDSFAHQFGPAFLIFLPALLLSRPPRRVVGLVVFAWAFLTICLSVRQSMRFVLLAIGPMAIGVAWLASQWSNQRGWAPRLLTGLVAVVLAFESLIAIGHTRHGIGVVIGRETAAHYLERHEPTWTVGRWIDRNLPADARIVGQDHRGFYLPRPYTMELAHRRRTGLATHGESAAEIIAHFRREGFTHLLLCPPVPETAVEFDPTLSRALAEWTAQHAPVYRAGLVDGDQVKRWYAIYRIDEDECSNPSPLRGADRVRGWVSANSSPHPNPLSRGARGPETPSPSPQRSPAGRGSQRSSLATTSEGLHR